MMIMSREISQIPEIAKKYLEVVLDSNKELMDFYINYYPNHDNIMIAVAKYRANKLKRRNFTFHEFSELYQQNSYKAISQLFLFPVNEPLYERYLIKPIESNIFSLEELYFLQREKPIFNPILVARELLAKI